MYATGPHAAAEPGVVTLVRAERMEFAGPAEFLTDPVHRMQMGRYLSDMVRPYGLKLHAEVYDGAAVSADFGHSYGEMAEALIGAAVPAEEPVDLLVLAFAIHDVRPGRATAAYLSHVCPGTPMAFAVCDQGSAAGYTGLRLIREYLLGGACTRALLLVVEHGSLPYDAPPVPLPASHAGVAMVFGAGPGLRLGAVRQHAGVPPEKVAELFGAGVVELAGGPAGARVVLGAGLAGHRDVDAAEVRLAPPSRPHTGVWWELAGEAGAVEPSGEAGPVVLGEYDRGLGYLCLAAFDGG